MREPERASRSAGKSAASGRPLDATGVMCGRAVLAEHKFFAEREPRKP